jgi:hypothetical protein
MLQATVVATMVEQEVLMVLIMQMLEIMLAAVTLQLSMTPLLVAGREAKLLLRVGKVNYCFGFVNRLHLNSTV